MQSYRFAILNVLHEELLCVRTRQGGDTGYMTSLKWVPGFRSLSWGCMELGTGIWATWGPNPGVGRKEEKKSPLKYSSYRFESISSLHLCQREICLATIYEEYFVVTDRENIF